MGYPVPGKYGRNNSVIGRYFIDTGALLWRYDVTDIARWWEWHPGGPERAGEVRKFLGVWRGRLYVVATNSTIIELDIETGKLLRLWRDLPKEQVLPTGWDKLVGLELAFLDAAAGEIACVAGQYYWRIDLHNGALEFFDLKEYFSGRELSAAPSFGDLAWDDTHIYFCSEFRVPGGIASTGKDVRQVAALNRRTRKIDWQQTVGLPPAGQWKQHPVLEGDRLYVLSHDLANLDQGGTLHIFERVAGE